MKKEKILIFLADFAKTKKEQYNILEDFDFPKDAKAFLEKCIFLAKRKSAIIDIALINSLISAELILPNGIFDKAKSDFLANLILSSNAFLILAPPEKSNQNFKVRFHFELKKH